MENQIAFLPAHDLLLPIAEIQALKTLLDAHSDRAQAAAFLEEIARRCGAHESAERRGALAAYQRGAESLARDGEIEVDESAVISKGDAPGAYVQAWLWVGDADAGLVAETAGD
ncbi:MAG: hypothetical protein JNK23_08635 [Opitutaceae bacterium]|nr:hypothetical protein [Opitutaceae bacterium]